MLRSSESCGRSAFSLVGLVHLGAAGALLAILALGSILAPTHSAAQGPTTELSAVQAQADALRQQISDTESELKAAQKAAEPKRKAADTATAQSDQADAKLDDLSSQVSAARHAAAAEIDKSNQDYEQELSDAQDTRSGGFATAGLMTVIFLVTYGFKRWRGWKWPRWATISGTAVLAILFVAGVVSGITTKDPEQPPAPSPETVKCALVDKPATEQPPAELQAAMDKADATKKKKAHAETRAAKAEVPVKKARAKLASLKADLKPLAKKEADLQHEVKVAEQKAAAEAAFRAEATTIDYNQLIKDPSNYRGTRSST